MFSWRWRLKLAAPQLAAGGLGQELNPGFVFVSRNNLSLCKFSGNWTFLVEAFRKAEINNMEFMNTPPCDDAELQEHGTS